MVKSYVLLDMGDYATEINSLFFYSLSNKI